MFYLWGGGGGLLTLHYCYIFFLFHVVFKMNAWSQSPLNLNFFFSTWQNIHQCYFIYSPSISFIFLLYFIFYSFSFFSLENFQLGLFYLCPFPQYTPPPASSPLFFYVLFYSYKPKETRLQVFTSRFSLLIIGNQNNHGQLFLEGEGFTWLPQVIFFPASSPLLNLNSLIFYIL